MFDETPVPGVGDVNPTVGGLNHGGISIAGFAPLGFERKNSRPRHAVLRDRHIEWKAIALGLGGALGRLGLCE